MGTRSSSRRRSVSLASFALVASLAGTTFALPTNDPAALKRFEEGKKALEAKDYPAALAAFQDSLQLLPSPNTRVFIGRCFRAMGKPASAYTAFRLASREAADRYNFTSEKRYKATMEAAAAESLEVEPLVPRLTIAVAGDVPDGTVVKMDDTEVPRPAWGAAVEVDPGVHHIVASGPRRQPFDKTVTIAEGQKTRLDVVLPKIPTGVIALRFGTRPGGLEVQLDGTPVDPTDWTRPKEVDTGEHKISVRAPGYEDFVWTKPVSDGERADIEVTLVTIKMQAPPPGGGTPKWLFFTVGGVAVASVGVATVLAVNAKSKSTDQKSLDPLQRDPDTQSKIRSLSGDANILFIAGSALAVGTGVLFFTTDWKGKPSETTTGASFRPFLTPTAGGLAASGRF